MELELGAAGDVTSTIPQLSGSIEPPNAGSPSFLVRYRPTVTFELSDGLQVTALLTARFCIQWQRLSHPPLLHHSLAAPRRCLS